MLTLSIREKNGEERQLSFDKEEVTIGRASGSDVVLPRNNISKRHARLVDKHDKVVIVDLRSTNGTYVNGRRITAPELLGDDDKVYIGDFVIRLAQAAEAAHTTMPYAATGDAKAAAGPPQPPPDPRMDHSATMAMEAVPSHDHAAKVDAPPHFEGYDDDESTQALQLADIEAMEAKMNAAPEPPAEGPPGPPPQPSQPPRAEDAPREAQRERPPQEVPAQRASPKRSAAAPPPEPAPAEISDEQAAWDEWNATVAVILEALASQRAPAVWKGASEVAGRVIDEAVGQGHIAPDVERDALLQDAVSEYVGLGPISELLADSEVERVTVSGPGRVHMQRAGVTERYGRVFASADSLGRAADRLLAEGGHDPSDAPPCCAGTLPNGVAFRVVRGPIARDGVAIVLHRPAPIQTHTFANEAARHAIRSALDHRRHVLITGGRPAERAAAISAILAMVDSNERLVVLSDGQAIVAPQLDVVHLARGRGPAAYDAARGLDAERIIIDDVPPGDVCDFVSLALSAAAPVLASVGEADPTRALEGLALSLALRGSAQRANALVGRAVGVVVTLDAAADRGPRVAAVAEVDAHAEGFELRRIAKG